MLSSPPLVNRRYLRALFSGQSAKSEHYWAEHRRRLRDLDTYLLNHLKHRPHLVPSSSDPTNLAASTGEGRIAFAFLKRDRTPEKREDTLELFREKIHDNLTRSR